MALLGTILHLEELSDEEATVLGGYLEGGLFNLGPHMCTRRNYLKMGWVVKEVLKGSKWKVLVGSWWSCILRNWVIKMWFLR